MPHGEDGAALQPRWPVFMSCVLSFVNVGRFWNNHHHMFHAVEQVGGRVLWANLHLLYGLSLMPFATAFMAENHFAPVTVAPVTVAPVTVAPVTVAPVTVAPIMVAPIMVAAYGFDLMMCAVACTLLVRALLAGHGTGPEFAGALGSAARGKLSLAADVAAIPLAFVSVWMSGALLVAVALIRIVPDRRFARQS